MKILKIIKYLYRQCEYVKINDFYKYELDEKYKDIFKKVKTIVKEMKIYNLTKKNNII